MKRILSLIVAVVATVWCCQAAHTLVNDTLKSSKIYPGTTHTYQVYVPEQYNGNKPACLYVGLDGVLCGAPEVMDSLIAAGKMPVTVGVFLQPGIIKDSKGNDQYIGKLTEEDRAAIKAEMEYVQNVFGDSLNFFSPYYEQFTFSALNLPDKKFRS